MSQSFADFDLQKVETWPFPVRLLSYVIAFCLVLAAGYYCIISDQYANYEASIKTVEDLKVEFKNKAKEAANLEAYKAQIAELETLLDAQLRQLPNSNEVANLLDDISFIAQDNGLNLISIKWESERPQEIYTELPMSIHVTGTYEQLGSFSADMAALPRIVTIEHFTLDHAKSNVKQAVKDAAKDGSNMDDDLDSGELLVMHMTAKTFRYNAEEVKKKNERRAKIQRAGGRR